ncbi:hypothetical protein [Hyalangium minutum]|uniref:Uncharacterized protein n=1 Tax=Hyalangium minutum TaxID=394096 RepID=A0A085WXV3_9BACT|nr:hypothetical protein [Hyalangium minutum]KFE72516.1 hypothetical protein DB31_0779 [Hyalangium minutum]
MSDYEDLRADFLRAPVFFAAGFFLLAAFFLEGQPFPAFLRRLMLATTNGCHASQQESYREGGGSA